MCLELVWLEIIILFLKREKKKGVFKGWGFRKVKEYNYEKRMRVKKCIKIGVWDSFKQNRWRNDMLGKGWDSWDWGYGEKGLKQILWGLSLRVQKR